jgi:hypothetical protein
MSITVSINGQSFNYPSGADQIWGTDATTAFQRLTEATLFQTGLRGDGAPFTLTADLDLGANFGVIAEFIQSKSAGAAIPSTGVLRLGNNESIEWRNNADSGNLILNVTTGDVLAFAGNKVLDASDIVNDDTTGGATVPASAEIVKTHGTEIDGKSQGGLFENTIINPIDENMVDQYSKTGTTVVNNEYCIDRWKCSTNQTADPTFNKGSDYIELVSNETTTSLLRHFQVVEDVNYDRLKGETVVLSADVISDNSECRLAYNDGVATYYSTAHTGGGTSETLSVSFTISASASTSEIFIGMFSNSGTSVSISTSDYARFRKAKLEKGSSRTDYKPRQYSEEEALCQRYAFKYERNTEDSIISTGVAVSGTVIRFSLVCPPQFRKGAVSFTSGSALFTCDKYSTSPATDGIVANIDASNGFSCNMEADSFGGVAMTQGDAYNVTFTSGSFLVINEL